MTSILVSLTFILLCVFLCICIKIKVSNKVAPPDQASSDKKSLRQPDGTKDGVKRITVGERPRVKFGAESIKAIESGTDQRTIGSEGIESKTIGIVGSVKAIKSEAIGNEAMFKVTTTDWAEFEANSTVRDKEIEPEPIENKLSWVTSEANKLTSFESEAIKGEQLTIETEAIREEIFSIREEAIESEVVKDKAIESEATKSEATELEAFSITKDDAFESETITSIIIRNELDAIGVEGIEPMKIKAHSIEVTECEGIEAVSTERVEAIESDAIVGSEATALL